jgi:PAS domain S-box-containing protein
LEYSTASLESEAGFRVLFECATVSILVISQRGEIELSNPCAETLFGYEPAELIGKPVEVLIPNHLRSRHEHLREHYFDAPKARPMGLGLELHARKKKGDIFPVAISLGYYELDRERLAVAFISDISDQVKANQLTVERETWFRNMADNSPVMIWVAGTDGKCTYFNNTWLKFTGKKLDDELGEGWAKGVHADDLARCIETYRIALESREPFTMEYRLRRHDAEYRWILDVGKPTFTDEGFTGFIGSCSDIHDQKIQKEELERLVVDRTAELNETVRREKEASELKSRFVSMASHEFRTPLSIILSSVSLIEQYVPESDDKVKKHLGRVRSSVNSLINILNDFLSLDKLEQGNVELQNQAFDIFDFVGDILDEYQPYKKKGQIIELSAEGAKDVVLDQNKMRYVVVNLLSNAIKYSPDRSTIALGIRVDDSRIMIRVKDNGIGIPEEDQKNLFNKFFRATNTANIQGTGLGLNIVKRYVELMGGQLSFSSKPGNGTEFIIDVPNTRNTE